MNKNVLLYFMIFCYLLPIVIVCYNYNCNSSLSNIICDTTCKYNILLIMILMGIATICYEIERNDKYSQLLMCSLLIGLYGLICINETHIIHYFFAFLVFTAILVFMVRHCYVKSCDLILKTSLFLELFLFLCIVINLIINENIFYPEIIYILNFAFYYIYLHTIS